MDRRGRVHALQGRDDELVGSGQPDPLLPVPVLRADPLVALRRGVPPRRRGAARGRARGRGGARAEIPMASAEDIRWARVKATAAQWFAPKADTCPGDAPCAARAVPCARREHTGAPKSLTALASAGQVPPRDGPAGRARHGAVASRVELALRTPSHGPLAQWLAHPPFKRVVLGSSPRWPTLSSTGSSGDRRPRLAGPRPRHGRRRLGAEAPAPSARGGQVRRGSAPPLLQQVSSGLRVTDDSMRPTSASRESSREERPQRDRLIAEQTEPQVAAGRHAQPIAGVAEPGRVGRDRPDLPRVRRVA